MVLSWFLLLASLKFWDTLQMFWDTPILNMTSVPLPSSLSISMFPFKAFINSLLIDRPSPMPDVPISPFSLLEKLAKILNSFYLIWLLMPTPLSITLVTKKPQESHWWNYYEFMTVAWIASQAWKLRKILMSPEKVNFTAFWMMFMMICWYLSQSASSFSGMSLDSRILISKFFC